MRIILVVCALLVASLLIIVSAQHSSSQMYQKARADEMNIGIDPEQKKELLKLLIPELLNDREFKRELVREIAHSMGPETVKVVADSIAAECAKDPQFRKEVLRSVMSSATSQLREMFASATHGGRSPNQAMLTSLISGAASRGIAVGRTQSFENGLRYHGGPGKGESLALSATDCFNVFVNPENQVRPLSEDEARQLFTGAFTNWNQLGGPDLPVDVVTWNDTTGAVESVLGKRVSPKAARLRYLSLVIPAVSRSRGAVAFLPAHVVGELPFVGRHEAMRNVSVTSDADARHETVPPENTEDVIRQAGAVVTLSTK